MKSWKLYHNPQCSKSREALQMIQASGLECEVVEYLRTPPDREELRRLIGDLQSPLGELVAERLASLPRLLERPILWGPQGAVIGRPIERIRQILEG